LSRARRKTLRSTGLRPHLLAGIALVVMPALGCVSSSDIEKLETQLTDVQQQLLRLQKDGASKAQVEALGVAIAEQGTSLAEGQDAIEARLGELIERVDELELELEDTNFRLAQLAQQIAATNQELQAVRSAALARQSPPPPPPQSPQGDPQTLYDSAYNDFLKGNYDLAILNFLEFLENDPPADWADNATFWLGEAYYRQGKFQRAISQYEQVVSRYEGSEHISSALLKKGFAYLELGQRAQAVVQLQQVVCDYGDTEDAAIARQRLDALGIDVQC